MNSICERKESLVIKAIKKTNPTKIIKSRFNQPAWAMEEKV
jgi:hypothetical protein